MCPAWQSFCHSRSVGKQGRTLTAPMFAVIEKDLLCDKIHGAIRLNDEGVLHGEGVIGKLAAERPPGSKPGDGYFPS